MENEQKAVRLILQHISAMDITYSDAIEEIEGQLDALKQSLHNVREKTEQSIVQLALGHFQPQNVKKVQNAGWRISKTAQMVIDEFQSMMLQMPKDDNVIYEIPSTAWYIEHRWNETMDKDIVDENEFGQVRWIVIGLSIVKGKTVKGLPLDVLIEQLQQLPFYACTLVKDV